MAVEVKFASIDYDYNNVSIEIPLDIAHASQIGISGVVIGKAADFDRIKGLCPTLLKLVDKVDDDNDCRGIRYQSTTGKIIGSTRAGAFELSKSGDNLKYKYELY